MSSELTTNDPKDKLQLAQSYASSDFVPEGFRRKPGNTLIAMDIANRSGSPVLEVMNNIFIDRSGKLGFQTPYAISMANRIGPFKHPIDWKTEKKENDILVTAFGVLKSNDQEVKSPPISYQKVKEAGWMSSSKGLKAVYVCQPIQMLKYKSALMLIRAYCSEVLFGMRTELDTKIIKTDKVNRAIDNMNQQAEEK